MALKGWKRIVNKQDIIVYLNENKEIILTKTRRFRTSFGHAGSSGWRVDGEITGSFKTKLQALKFAISYMRKR